MIEKLVSAFRDWGTPMLTSEEIARGLWSAIADADLARLRELIHPEATWQMHGRSSVAGRFEGVDAILDFMARVGENADELQSELLEVFGSEGGAVLRYGVRALRGDASLDIEHLFMIEIESGRIVKGVFAPLDQYRYDEFWLAESAPPEPALGSIDRPGQVAAELGSSALHRSRSRQDV